MSSELPNELWSMVLSRLRDVRDWGRMQQINKTFHALVASNCWPRVHTVEVAQTSITINGQTLELSLFHRVLLLMQLTAKSKLTALHLKDMDPPHKYATETIRRDKELLVELLSLLSQKALNLEELELEGLTIHSTPIIGALASFLTSISASLKTLHLAKVSIFAPPPVLLQSFQACSLLEAISFDVRPLFGGDVAVLVFAHSILSGKDKLESLHITCSEFLNTRVLAVMLLVNSGARLTSLSVSRDWASKWGSFFWNYTWAVHSLLLSASHPLRTLKKLYLDVFFGFPQRDPIPWQLCPELELVSLASLHQDDLPVLYGGFVHAFHKAGAMEKVVRCIIPVLYGNGDVEGLVAQIQAQVPCQAMVTELVGGGVEIFLIRGNTIFTIRSHNC